MEIVSKNFNRGTDLSMVFSSVTFLLLFFPAVLALYYLTPKNFRTVRNLVLLAASLIFYGCCGISFLYLMFAVILLDYFCGLIAGIRTGKGAKLVSRIGVWLAVVGGIGLLGYFKYAGFITENLALLGLPVEVLKVTLPVGISFFTFQGLSYVIDVYRGDVAVQKNPFSVALYVSLFPQLVAGPIVRYSTVEDEIMNRRESLEGVSDGLCRFVFGLAKKMILANPMGEIADEVFGHGAEFLPASLAWVGILAYTLQIYFDFSAYSDMAIGLGRVFGFHFLENFNYPYISRNITEFWRRWHISLSTWFRDYVYIPLGGSRCSTFKNIRNLCVVWLATGIWHGASWNFVVWGLWFLAFLLGEKFIWGKLLDKLPAVVRWLYTIFVVMISWVFFRSPTLGYATTYIGALFGAHGGIASTSAVYYILEYWPEWLCAVVACLPIRDMLKGKLQAQNRKLCDVVVYVGPRVLALILFALSYIKLVTGSFNPFIYFQF